MTLAEQYSITFSIHNSYLYTFTKCYFIFEFILMHEHTALFVTSHFLHNKDNIYRSENDRLGKFSDPSAALLV
jgi:hypothetical protein